MVSGPLRHGSLFTGIGGLDLAVAEVLLSKLMWVCDNDPAAIGVLAKRFPGVPNLGDITKVDWAEVPPVDILSGGFPCQDVSCAGLRKGLNNETRSGLWRYFAEAIDALRPGLVIIENVRGLLSAKAHRDLELCPDCLARDKERPTTLRALGAVLGDLADIGYDAIWRGVRASDVGAAHQRLRIVILAHPQGSPPTDPNNIGRGGGGAGSQGRDGGLNLRTAAVKLFSTPKATDGSKGGPNQRGSSGDLMLPSAVAIERWSGVVNRGAPRPLQPGVLRADRVRRCADELGCTDDEARAAIESGQWGPVLAPPFVEWLMGFDEGWVTDVDGISRGAML